MIKHGKADPDYINKSDNKSIIVLAVELRLAKAVEYLSMSNDFSVNYDNLRF